MEPLDLEEFRALITDRLDELEKDQARGRRASATVELDQQAIGRLSRQDALQAQAMAKAHQARRSGEAARLRAALGRIDAGDFGFCEDCGESIVPARLRLDPTTRRCVDCAQGG